MEASLCFRVILFRQDQQLHSRLVFVLRRQGCIYNLPFMDLGLRNRVAIVAASSQGIGLATAEAFAAEGCRVAMCARNGQKLEAAGEEVRKRCRAEVFTQALDVTDADAVHDFVDALAKKFGSVDICVTN